MYKNIACIADKTATAQGALHHLLSIHPELIINFEENLANIDVIIILGGDGFMLHNMHKFTNKNIPLYGINCGTVGFLLNMLNDEDIYEKINNAKNYSLHPLDINILCENEKEVNLSAYNELSLLRQTIQAAHLKITINNQICLNPLIADGLIIATPAGSSSYNMSAGGSIIPVGANLLALTALNSFRPRRWKGALLISDSYIECEILNSEKRPVQAAADFIEVRNVQKIKISESKDKIIKILFDRDHGLEYRIFKEQFAS